MNDRVHENFWSWISGYDDAPLIIRLGCQPWINISFDMPMLLAPILCQFFLAGKTADIAAKNSNFA